jgi:hypothetical protein
MTKQVAVTGPPIAMDRPAGQPTDLPKESNTRVVELPQGKPRHDQVRKQRSTPIPSTQQKEQSAPPAQPTLPEASGPAKPEAELPTEPPESSDEAGGAAPASSYAPTRLELTQQETPVLVSAPSPVTAPVPIGSPVQQGTAPAPSEAPSSVSPSSIAIAQPAPEEEPNWFGIGTDGIVRIGSAATDWSQGWLWEDPDDHKLRFIHQKPPAKAPDKGE